MTPRERMEAALAELRDAYLRAAAQLDTAGLDPAEQLLLAGALLSTMRSLYEAAAAGRAVHVHRQHVDGVTYADLGQRMGISKQSAQKIGEAGRRATESGDRDSPGLTNPSPGG